MKNQRPTPPSNRLLSLIFGEGAHVCGAPIDESTFAPTSHTGMTTLLKPMADTIQSTENNNYGVSLDGNTKLRFFF